MSNLTKQWPIIIYLTLLSVIGPRVIGPIETQAAGGPDVIVTNTPLPVSIDGTANVNLAGTPVMSIDSQNNTVSLLREPENPARQPYQARIQCFFNNENSCTDSTHINVPSGKVLVIEFVSMNAGIDSGDGAGLATLDVIQQASGPSQRHYFPLLPTIDNGTVAILVASQQTRLYADPSSNVRVSCGLSDPSNAGCFGSVSGHLVDVP
jgi:hypothetical protein